MCFGLHMKWAENTRDCPRMLLAFLIISCSSICVDSRTITVREGLAAVLPCTFNTRAQTPYVQWRTDSEVVFERRRAESYEGPGYEDRADVPEDELRKGNCSLVLQKIRKADEGIYNSYLLRRRAKRAGSPDWRLIQSVELAVDVPKETPNPTAKDNTRVSRPPLLATAVCLLSGFLLTKETL